MSDKHRFGFLNAEWWGGKGEQNGLKIRRYEIAFSEEKKLYHYTSMGGLKGIIEDGGVWASHVAYMNDAEEVTHGYKLARDVLRAYAKKVSETRFKDILEQVARRLDVSKLPDLYIACFSKEGDSLDQWRGYCSGGGGVAVEFDISQHNPFQILPVMVLSDVVYGKINQVRRIMLMIRRYEYEFERDLKFYSSIPERYEDEYINSISSKLEFMAPVFKNPAFVNEREVRMLIYGSKSSHFASKKTRATSHYIIPYFLSSDLTGKDKDDKSWKDRGLPISRVTIGPSPHAELTARSVREFLAEKGHKAEVQLSKVPFRAS